MKVHMLKTWPKEYEAVYKGFKMFDVRKNDRDFQVGDKLLLQEWNPDLKVYTGRETPVMITYLMQGKFGLPEDLCVLSIKYSNR